MSKACRECREKGDTKKKKKTLKTKSPRTVQYVKTEHSRGREPEPALEREQDYPHFDVEDEDRPADEGLRGGGSRSVRKRKRRQNDSKCVIL